MVACLKYNMLSVLRSCQDCLIRLFVTLAERGRTEWKRQINSIFQSLHRRPNTKEGVIVHTLILSF